MVDQELLWTLQSIAAVASTIGVIGTLTAAFIAVRSYINVNKRAEEAKKIEQETRDRELVTRQIQNFMQYYRSTERELRINREEILNQWSWTSLEDFWEKYGSDKHPDQFKKFYDITAFYEEIGLLVKEKQIDLRIIYAQNGPIVIRFWEKFESFFIDYRMRFEAPPKGMQNELFEDLYYVMKEIREDDKKALESRLYERKERRKALGLKPLPNCQ
ncbi:hypothetical protein JW865_08055 [Candidatus Bathyarchaeota archaeon]|nr:hypothetical protein [Candidatus Bathyarchaeota archaeon]